MVSEKSSDKTWSQQARSLVEAFLRGETGKYGLTPQRILEVAKGEVQRKGYVHYDDYNPDLLIEVLNGVRPDTVGFRLFYIKNVLLAHLFMTSSSNIINIA